VSSCVNFFVLILFGGRVGAFRDSVGLQEKKSGAGKHGRRKEFCPQHSLEDGGFALFLFFYSSWL